MTQNQKTSKPKNVLAPQAGPQEQFLASPADIVVYGGAAGGGKTFGLLLSPLRYKNIKGFGCTIFRKNHYQIYSEGGLWDEASSIYGAIPNMKIRKSLNQFVFCDKNGRELSKVTFSHIDRDDDLLGFQGSQICELDFDELTHFSEKIFFYMLSRNRSSCGVKPYIRATCNPDPDSWVAKFISWWINPDTGYPIPERSGVIRWFLRREETIHWASTKAELCEQFGLITKEQKAEPKSVTFIASSVYDNKILLDKDPGYLANLKAMPVVDRERLLNGNWKIRPAAGLYFSRTQIGRILTEIPDDIIKWVRAWDLAATTEEESEDAAYTAGVLIGKRECGRYLVADVINVRKSASEIRKLIHLTAQIDKAKYGNVRIRLPQDPGQAGKDQAQTYIKLLAGFSVTAVQESGSKETRAEPMAAQWQVGHFDIMSGDWNEVYLNQLENFPVGQFKDMVDASANGFAEIELANTFNIRNLI